MGNGIPSLIVYTAIIGPAHDKLRCPQGPPDHRGRHVDYVCYSDALPRVDAPWELRAPSWEHVESSRRTARWHKINAHKLFPDADFTIWHDGTHQLRVNPWELIDRFMVGDAPLGVLQHCQRTCVYHEMDACIRLRKDDPGVMRKQVQSYRVAGYPEGHGLWETGVVIRRPSASEFNDEWWRQIEQGSFRDQLSVNFAQWRLGTKYILLPGCGHRSHFFTFYPHGRS